MSSSPARPTAAPMVWSLEGWRGLAGLMVFVAHTVPVFFPAFQPLPMVWAYSGLDILFVLSGYVFGRTLYGMRESLWTFYLRRLFRIYPAYLVALLIYVLIAAHEGKELTYLVEHVFMLHLQSREMAFYYNPAFWSLPPELAFYIVLPLLALLINGRLDRLVLTFILALMARGFILLYADSSTQNTAYILNFHLTGMLCEMLMGSIAYFLVQRGYTGNWSATQRWLAFGGLWAGWLLLGAVYMSHRDDGWIWGNLTVLCAMLWAAFLLITAPIQQAPSWFKWLCAWGGNLSYSTYLLHIAWLLPAKWVLESHGPGPALAVCFIGTVASAWLLNQTVEFPMRSLGRRLGGQG